MGYLLKCYCLFTQITIINPLPRNRKSAPKDAFPLCVFVEDDKGTDDAGHPAAEGEEKNNEHRTATTVNDCKRRENDRQYYT